MTKVEELKKRYDDLYSQSVQLKKRVAEAESEYQNAIIAQATEEFASRGIVPGVKVVAVYERVGRAPVRTECGFLGVEIPYLNETRAILSKLKKDGTPSKAKAHIPYDTLELLEDDQ